MALQTFAFDAGEPNIRPFVRPPDNIASAMSIPIPRRGLWWVKGSAQYPALALADTGVYEVTFPNLEQQYAYVMQQFHVSMRSSSSANQYSPTTEIRGAWNCSEMGDGDGVKVTWPLLLSRGNDGGARDTLNFYAPERGLPISPLEVQLGANFEANIYIDPDSDCPAGYMSVYVSVLAYDRDELISWQANTPAPVMAS